MAWIIAHDTNTEALVVINEPTINHVVAVEAYDSSIGIKVRGDRLPEAKPLVIEIGIHEADHGQALAKLKRLLNIARAGGRLRYTEGTNTLEREFSSLKSWAATRWEPAAGLIEIGLELLPAGPYWTDSLGNRVVWAW